MSDAKSYNTNKTTYNPNPVTWSGFAVDVSKRQIYFEKPNLYGFANNGNGKIWETNEKMPFIIKITNTNWAATPVPD